MRIRTLIISLPLLGLLAYIGSVYAAQPMHPEFTLKQIQIVRSADGAISKTAHHMFAHRKDGAVLSRETFPASNVTTSLLLLPGERKRVVVEDTMKYKSTYPASEEQVSFWRSPGPADCSLKIALGNPVFLGEATMLAVKVVRYRLSTPEEIVEMSMAPALACQSLHEIHHWKDANGKLTGSQTVKETIELRMGEPDNALFTVSEELTEARPSVGRMARLKHITGKTSAEAAECFLNGNKFMDEAYNKANRNH